MTLLVVSAVRISFGGAHRLHAR